MKKISIFLFLILFLGANCLVFGAFSKKEKASIVFSSVPVEEMGEFGFEHQDSVFKLNSRIYFCVQNPKGFESDYIRYQLVKQDDNAHIGGLTRVRNIVKRINSKNSYCDYLYLTQKGKYYLQVFDITNLHQWLAIGKFLVVDE